MNTQKHTVLLVEDEEPAALALKNELEQRGFNVLTASDGEVGVTMALEHHPDVILADLKLPKQGGLEMIRTIRADEWGKRADIIILTNISDVGTLEKAMTDGTFFYMVKGDVSMEDIVAKVSERVRKNPGESQ